jgi:hypothetical protein
MADLAYAEKDDRWHHAAIQLLPGMNFAIDEYGSADIQRGDSLTLQLHFLEVSESMGNHDSKIVDAGSID